MPALVKRPLTSDAVKIALASRLSQSIAARGVPAGAKNANHAPASISGNPASCMVGTSGNNGERCRAVRPRARNLPSLILFMALPIRSKVIGTWPASTSWLAGAAPRYCTPVMSVPV